MIRTMKEGPLLWKQIALVDPKEEKQNPVDFRAYAYLLIPAPGHVAVFRAQCNEYERQYFIGSDTLPGLDKLSSFFFHLYKASTEKEAPKEWNGTRITMIPSRRRSSEFFHPTFLRTLLYIPSAMREAKVDYTVVVSSRRRFGRLRYSFLLSLKSDAPRDKMQEILDLIRMEVLELKRRSGFKLRITGGNRATFRNDSFRLPFNLLTFIHLPLEEQVEMA